MTCQPADLQAVLFQYLADGRSVSGVRVHHTRGKNRGGVLRLTMDGGDSVVVKLWRLRNLKERFKSLARFSNGRREWRMHRLIHLGGISVPEPLAFLRFGLPDGERFEALALEDLGETERGLPHLKRLIAAGEESAVATFEERLIASTAEIIGLGIVDIDHQLNNFLVDSASRLLRIDFECAWRPLSMAAAKKTLAEMFARLLTSHVYAVQPDVRRTEKFATKLYARLHISGKMSALIQSSVCQKLENQRVKNGVASAVVLPG